MLTVEAKVKELVRKPWWSPNAPETYVTAWGVGLGKEAHRDYAAFNLIWAGYKLNTTNDHAVALEAFYAQIVANDELVFDTPLRDWITLLDPIGFKVWYLVHEDHLSEPNRRSIDKAIDGLARLHHIQQ